jgi:hypothetical protein
MMGRGHALPDLVISSGRNTVARTTQGRRQAETPRQGRFARGSTGKAHAPRRFARPSGGSPRGRRRQPEQGGAQKLMRGIRGVLPGGRGKSSAKSARGSIAAVGDRVSSLGRTKARSGGRARKPAIFGALGAGAAGAAAAVAKRRHGRRSSGETRDVPEAQATPTAGTTPAQAADAPPPGASAHGTDTPPDPDTPATGDAR